MNDDEGNMMVWLVRDCESFNRMHEMILIERRDASPTLYELGGWRPGNLVEQVLSVTSFQGGDPNPAATPREVPLEEVEVIKMVGFGVPDSRMFEVVEAIDRGFREGPGGFAAIVMAQSGFHMSPYVFKQAWEAAGMPRLLVRHPEMAHGESAASGPPRTPYINDIATKLSLLRRGLDLTKVKP